MSREYKPGEVSHLAALSRAYHEAWPDILDAMVQEVRKEPDQLGFVIERFGLTAKESSDLERLALPTDSSPVRQGLNNDVQVYDMILDDIEEGRLKRGDQLPPRKDFIVRYRCSKAVHDRVTRRLDAKGIIARPGGVGGPLYIQ